VVLHRLAGSNDLSLRSASAGRWAYLAVCLFVVGDALFPVVPGETTVNAAATLAAQGALALPLVVFAAALGAIVGDSCLYWCARRGRGRFEPRIARVSQNARVATVLGFLGENAPLVLVVGRYVPLMRFVTTATFGLSAYP
jgi:membrane protein DedA with SNARE-associated domain